MPNFTLSPSMSLPIPVVGVAPGPEYAEDVNSALTILDGHDHSAGSGVQITPGGLDINSDLTFGNNNLTNARSLRLFPQSATLGLVTDIGCLYEVGVDLYYNDGGGTPIRITQSGGVAGSPGSIANLVPPASATYVALNSTFVWQSAANTAANMDGGSFIFRKLTSGSPGITMSAPSSLSSNYSIVLPSLPVSTSALTIDPSGNMGTITYDGIGQGMTSTGANAIGSSMTSTGANAVANSRTRATGTTVAAGGVALSGSSNSFSTSSLTPSDVTNLSVTITSTGRPIQIGLICDETNAFCRFSIDGGGTATIFIYRDSTLISSTDILGDISIPPSSVNMIDFPAAGTYTYKIQLGLAFQPGGAQAFLQFARLCVYEL